MSGPHWEQIEGVVCVVCPDCAFTFGAEHQNTRGGGYTCPNCQPAPPSIVETTWAEAVAACPEGHVVERCYDLHPPAWTSVPAGGDECVLVRYVPAPRKVETIDARLAYGRQVEHDGEVVTVTSTTIGRLGLGVLAGGHLLPVTDNGEGAEPRWTIDVLVDSDRGGDT